jgi:hypothetical protein
MLNSALVTPLPEFITCYMFLVPEHLVTDARPYVRFVRFLAELAIQEE